MIKTIIFDLGKVIVPFDFKRGYDRLAPLCGYAAELISERLRTCDLVTRFESGKVEAREFVREMGRVLEFDSDYDQFCEIWSSIFLEDTLIPDELLERLHRRYRLLLLSNTNSIHFEMVEKNYPLLRHFDEFILSYKVGALKPEPVIYRAALDKAGCRPEECFYTDDIEPYVRAARTHGIDAVQFESKEQIEAELRARHVDW